MTTVISVRFHNGTKTYYFDPRGVEVQTGDDVVVETSQGLEFAHCTQGTHQVEDDQVVQPLRPMIRIATENDRNTDAYNRTREKEAFDICQKKIAAHKLEMKLVRVECSFDGSKIIFFFTADGRVDFRELVKDLAGVFRSRIELRQIGVRDEAKMLGGLGICGRPFCCAQFMDDFMPVSIKMAKTQNLSLNPTKISGTCGRLMCCLKYEQDAYEDALKRLPKNDSFVLTPDGPGNVSDVNVLKETVNVKLDERNDGSRCYHNCEICVLRNGKGSREGIEIPDKRPERYVEEREDPAIPAVVSDFSPEPFSDDEMPGEDAGEKRRRRGRGHRGGKKHASGVKKETEERTAPKEATVEVRPAVKAEPKQNEGRRRNRRGGHKSSQNVETVTAKPAVVAQGSEMPHKRTHRGGRRHRGGAPKAEG